MQLKITQSTLVLITIGILALHTNIVQSDSTSEKILKEKPIVIQTQAQTYDEPTLTEYQQCHENLDQCLKVCESTKDKTTCEAQCPTCPILIHQDVVVQGINDTDHYRLQAAKPLNTTNVIRLTNEIRNIIDNNMGNITARNENNIHIHQNVSSIGGKYGLGYNDRGSCCHVVRSSKNCDAKQFSTAARCHHKRHRVCGERCKSRVMYAKRVTTCNDTDEDTSCHQSVQYVPSYNRPVHSRPSARPRCHSTSWWPYVSCPTQTHQRMPSCHRCIQLSYGYILSHGIPMHCRSCYSQPTYTPQWQTPMYYPPQPMYPPVRYPSYGDNFDFGDEFLPSDGWTLEKTKCRLEDGTIIENCHTNNKEDGSGDDTDLPVFGGEDPLENLPEPEDDPEDNYDIDDEYNSYDDDLAGVEPVRHRRQTFRRSAYSHRNH